MHYLPFAIINTKCDALFCCHRVCSLKLLHLNTISKNESNIQANVLIFLNYVDYHHLFL